MKTDAQTGTDLARDGAPVTSRVAVQTGLDRVRDGEHRLLAGQRVGLLVHPASVDSRLDHATGILAAAGVDLRSLFGPQHGIRGDTQDNMVEWEGFLDPETGLPVHSLYGATREPSAAMLDGLDTMVIDLQDVGARVYTFIWTLLLALRACARAGVRVVVLDRPNPLGGEVLEGNLLDMRFASFVGMAPIPIRHGLTIGEAAVFLREHFRLELELEVVWMRGWRRSLWFEDTGLGWVMPSPNMPAIDTAVVYPGMVALEGTELSEGRGTTRPFEIFGAPFIEPERLVPRLRALRLPGVVFRPLHFEPTFHKHAGCVCGGAQIHVVDRARFRSVLTATAVLTTVRELWPQRFQWRQPPYEYETEKPPIDILAGGPWLRRAVDQGDDPHAAVAAVEADLPAFRERAAGCLHYT